MHVSTVISLAPARDQISLVAFPARETIARLTRPCALGSVLFGAVSAWNLLEERF
jgi:hypothetical protein